MCGGRQGEEKRKTEEERTGGIKRILEERATLRCDGGFSAPLVVNLHSALRRLTGNFPAGLLAACKTPTQSRERAAQGTGGGEIASATTQQHAHGLESATQECDTTSDARIPTPRPPPPRTPSFLILDVHKQQK